MDIEKKEADFFSTLTLMDNDLILVFFQKANVAPPDTSIFTYRFAMKNKNSGDGMGGINIKAGYTENIINFRGNIGFTVYEEYRGHHYSSRSCMLLIPVIQFLGLDPIYLTCDEHNYASQKNIEMIGATFIEKVTIPEDSPYLPFYPEGSRTKLRYKWEIK
jgi:predicted acetyltransferase